MSFFSIINKINKNNQINHSKITFFEPYEEFKLEDFYFEKDTNKLSFNIVKYSYKAKIERYIQRNYQRYPIYSNTPSISTKKYFTFNKIINLGLFCEDQIRNLDIDDDFKKEICNKLEYLPKWLKIKNEINDSKKEIKLLKNSFKSFQKKEYNFLPQNYKEKPSNLWLRLFFLLFTIGLSFIGFVSKKKAEANILLNNKNKIWNETHKQEIDSINLNNKIETEKFNLNLQQKINILQLKISDLNFLINNIEPTKNEDGWIKIKDAFNFSNRDLESKKGVYIIWNKTKNIYYVGQSKNLYKRIFTQHFSISTADVKNVIFAKDWYDSNEFLYKIFFCETKDELDNLEKKYIEIYDSFKNGYNSTNGNI